MTRDRLIFCLLYALGSLAGATAQAADAEFIASGKTLYNQNCVFCHQPDAIGKPGLAPSLTNPELLAISSDKYLMSTIRDGRTGTSMVPYAHLGRAKIKAIVAYLRSHESLPYEADAVDGQAQASGDPRLGEVWFRDVCSACHGVEGDGYLAGGSGTAIGKSGFLDKVSDGYIRETIKRGRSNTRMLAFQGPAGLSNMTDEEIDDIISYMRTLNH